VFALRVCKVSTSRRQSASAPRGTSKLLRRLASQGDLLPKSVTAERRLKRLFDPPRKFSTPEWLPSSGPRADRPVVVASTDNVAVSSYRIFGVGGSRDDLRHPAPDSATVSRAAPVDLGCTNIA
jgi:hypothetical protein